VAQVVDVFISYAQADESLRKELDEHLALLKREGVIRAFYDRMVTPGEDYKSRIDEHLDAAQIILLLVSASYLASDYLYHGEMTRALDRERAGKVLVLPVLLRPCDWSGAPFARISPLPHAAKPITTWPLRDAAWTAVAVGLRAAVKHMMGHAEPFAPTEDRRPPHVPIVAQPPTLHNLPLRRLFVGRTEALSMLGDTLQRKRTASLFALAGTGKTALALEYAHRAVEQGTYPGGVWWVLAEGSPSIDRCRPEGLERALLTMRTWPGTSRGSSGCSATWAIRTVRPSCSTV
jgi:hypothetical protein